MMPYLFLKSALMLAIIGGTGLTQLPGLTLQKKEIITTPYGKPSTELLFGTLQERQVIFLARHGESHTIAPHEINYRANLWALQHAGATKVLAMASVGGIRADLSPLCFLVPDQVIDYTYGRHHTFYEGEKKTVVHIDFTQPYDASLRARLIKAGSEAGEIMVNGGTYGVTQGPRLESAAEINRLAKDGVDVVGMTGMPEAALAKELALPYATLCVVANHAAGRGSSQTLEFSDIQAAMLQSVERLRTVILKFLSLVA
jgi:5'-deoxy-5'-methylthioadenosine phosphorylase